MRSTFLLLLASFPVACGGAGGATLLAAPHEPTELLLMLADPDDDDEVEDLRQDFDGVTLERIGSSSFFLLHVPAGTDLQRLLERLDDDLRVVDSQPNYLGALPEGDPSHQPTFGDDDVSSVAVQPALAALRLPAAHARSTGAGVVVAVVDTGIDPTHPLLVGRIAPGGFDFIGQDADPTEERNFRDDDGDRLVDEQFGHGTFVASLVLAAAPDAMILPVRALNDEGVGTVSTVAAGILWAADAGARVVNVSVEVPNSPELLREAIDYARSRGAFVVAAAGNGARADVTFPARYENVMAVAAVDNGGVAAPFTSVGSAVGVVAPGVEILGAMPFARAPRGTARWSGTSFSAPLVAGTAALVDAAFPGLDGDDVGVRIAATAGSVDAINPMLAGRLGRGMVDAAAAVGP